MLQFAADLHSMRPSLDYHCQESLGTTVTAKTTSISLARVMECSQSSWPTALSLDVLATSPLNYASNAE